MKNWMKKPGALFLVLALLLAWAGSAAAWIEIGPGPTGGTPDRPGDTDPDDFPIVASGHEQAQINVEGDAVPDMTPQAKLLLFLARFM